MNHNCLLCGATIDEPLSIYELLTFKSKRQQLICNQCQKSFIPLQGGCKDCCKLGPFIHGRCSDCIGWQKQGLGFKNISLYQYNSAMKHYFQQYKFKGDYYLRHVFMDEVTTRVKQFHRIIVPIPVSSETMTKRGFNQVTGLLNVKFTEALQTNKRYHQSALKRNERLQMQQPFSLADNADPNLKNADVLLVDDIYTTGSTLHLAAKLLMESGCKSIQSFTLAR